MFVMSAVGPAKSADFLPIERKRLTSFDRKDPFLNDCVLQAVRESMPHFDDNNAHFQRMMLKCAKRIRTY